MGCCNNKKDCTNKPTEEFTDITSWILNGLMDVVKTGRIPSLFKNPAADQLAGMIATLVDENKYLRAILGVLKPDLVVAEDQFQIAFGPGKQYTLTIPVPTDSDRKELIEALRAAIVKLENTAPPDTKQLPLF